MTEDNTAVTLTEEAYMTTETAITNSTAWIINFSASSHITADKKLFVNNRNIKWRIIFIIESTVLWTMRIDEVRIFLWKSKILLIKNVLYISELSNSLLFIP